MPLSDRVRERLDEAGIPLKVAWMRGYGRLNFLRAAIWLILGIKGSGKSALIETLALYSDQIIDLFGSRDNENLCWLRDSSPIDDILLVVGDNVDLNCSWPVKRVSELKLKDILDHELTTTCNAFYTNQEQRFIGVGAIIDRLWDRDGYNSFIDILIREASSFLYSRMKIEGSNMKEAKADFIFMQREMRHLGYSMKIDTIRWTSIDKEMRDLSDYLVVKKTGRNSLPSDIDYLYRYCDPVGFATMRPDRFVIQSDYPIGLGISGLPKFHKLGGESLIKELDINPEYGEIQELSTAQQVGDQQHADIIRMSINGVSQSNIAAQIHRSSSTVNGHIHRHNREVSKTGECDKCRRVSSELSKTIVETG